jgi:adenosylhomocysteinase
MNEFHFIETMPLLKWAVDQWKDKSLKDIQILLIIHLLQDASAFVHALKLLGANKIIIIGKHYSTVKQSVKEIKMLGFDQIFEPTNQKQLEEYVYKNLQQILSENDKVLILEDGGYCSKIIYDKKLETTNLIGIVEQTTIGINRDKKVIENNQINYPIINIAETKTKTDLESIEIGCAVRRNIENLLTIMNITIKGKDVLVVGFGTIGQPIADAFKNVDANVSVYDIDPFRRIKARYCGFPVSELKKGIMKAQIVIGCTGVKWAYQNELLNLKDNVILICATSERIEYDHDYLDTHKSTSEKSNWGIKFELKGKKINLLADGYPVNFYGASAKESIVTLSVPAESFQIISVLLLWGLLLLNSKQYSSGIIEFPKEDEYKIDKKFEEIIQNEVI